MTKDTCAFYVLLSAPTVVGIETCRLHTKGMAPIPVWGQSLMTLDALVFVQGAIATNTESQKSNFGVGQWIKSSSWEVTYTDALETGVRVYA